jgi:hypothetical protein
MVNLVNTRIIGSCPRNDDQHLPPEFSLVPAQRGVFNWMLEGSKDSGDGLRARPWPQREIAAAEPPAGNSPAGGLSGYT